MTQERDDYMRRQEADHDLLRMRQLNAVPGRAPVPILDYVGIQKEVARQLDLVGEYEMLHRLVFSPRARVEDVMRKAGASDEWIAFVIGDVCSVMDELSAREYYRGVSDGHSRARNRPGDGDMGG